MILLAPLGSRVVLCRIACGTFLPVCLQSAGSVSVREQCKLLNVRPRDYYVRQRQSHC